MENSADQDVTLLDTIKDHVSSLLHAPQPRIELFASAAYTRSLRNQVETIFKAREVAVSLLCAPHINCVNKNAFEICFSLAR